MKLYNIFGLLRLDEDAGAFMQKTAKIGKYLL